MRKNPLPRKSLVSNWARKKPNTRVVGAGKEQPLVSRKDVPIKEADVDHIEEGQKPGDA
jgi:hypothetical protein